MEKQFKILLVDDEKRILTFLKSKLKASGYTVLTSTNGADALEQMKFQEPDLVVLDLVMPQMNGFEVLKSLRLFSSVPVIILSAKGSDSDKIKGLGLGADDYLSKPFNPDELVARIEAVKRRIDPVEVRKKTEPLTLGNLAVDFESRRITVNGQEKNLTRIEWLLLNELARNSGRLVLYEDLLTRVWGAEYRDDVQILRTWISRLREKIEDKPSSPKLVKTIPKSGYIFNQIPECPEP